jgi:MraZ protein
MDSKGRLAVPARHRARLSETGGKVIVTADLGGCLLLYPLASWEPIERHLNSLSGFDPRIRSLQRLLIGHAHDLELDASGRILLPPMLREYAGLEKEIIVVGQGAKLELWKEEAWLAEKIDLKQLREQGLPPELAGISL